MGLSWIGPGGYGDLLNAVRDTHPPYVVIANEVKASQDVRRVSPNTLVHFRITGHDSIDNPTRESGAARVRWLLPTFLDSRAQLLSIANEWTPSGDTPDDLLALRVCCDCYRGAMDEANRSGIKIAVGDFSVANPHVERPGVMDAIRPMLAQADRDGHYLCVNYYARGGDPLTDPDALHWTRMVKDYPHLRVVIREYSVLAEDMPRGEAFTALMRAGDTIWRDYPQLVGAALYTLMGFPDSRWKRFEYPGELSRYSAWLAAV